MYLKTTFNRIKNTFSRSSLKTGAIFTSGNMIVAVIGIIGTLLYGRWIEPDVLGEFKKYSILTGYLAIGIVFVDGAFSRHFPYYIGKGDKEKATKIAGVAKWWYLLLAYSGIAVFSVLALHSLINGNQNGFLGWLAQIPIYAFSTYGLYLGILYRSNDDFEKLNYNNLFSSAFGLLALPLVYFLQFTGLAFRTIIQHIVMVVTYHRYSPLKVKAIFKSSDLVQLAKVSLPLQLPAYLDTHLLHASISLIILTTLGEKELGIYGMAILIQGFLLVFSKSLNQIITTKLMLKYGSNDNMFETFKYVIKPVVILTMLSIIVVVFFIYTIDPIIKYFLPKYSNSIVVAQILSLELILSIVRNPFSLFISSLQYKEMAIIRVLKVILTITFLAFFNNNITEIAGAVIFANFLNVVAGYILLIYKMKRLPI
jgi:O-antigen/teichoic acid export membrane protein